MFVVVRFNVTKFITSISTPYISYNYMTTRYRLEQEINTLVQKDNGSSAHFIWKLEPGYNRLTCRVVTLNPRHDTHFLLCQESLPIPSTTTEDYETEVNQVYLQILQKIKNLLLLQSDTNKQNDFNLLTYVIEWNKISSSGDTITSYFSGQTLQEVIEKFYFEKSPLDVIVYHIRLVSES